MAEKAEAEIGKYKVIGLLAKGGMGAVYKAKHPTLNRTVILKKLTIKGNPQFIERFKREAKIMMDFKHDNIVTVYDHFKEGNSYYIVLEYVDGSSLDELIKKERALPSVLAMYVFLEICRALKYAHDTGVIHRDIKPANVLISRSGEVKLVDFGIAAYEEETEGEKDLTTHGMTLGTPSYMPPEQFEDTKSVGKAADIYAMGVVLYEMVTGRKPFPGNFAPDTINMIQKGRYVRVLKINPKIDKTIAKLIGKMIKPKKEQRYQDLGHVVKILEHRLKHEDLGQAEKHLRAMMNNRPFKAKPSKKRTVRKIVLAAIVLALVAAAPVAWLASTGMYHEWLDPGDWGKFDVAVVRPSSVQEAMPLSIQLYSDKKGDIKRAADLDLPGFWRGIYSYFYKAIPKLPAKYKPAPGLSTDLFYAKPGFYRLKIQTGNKLLWDSFYLEPLITQRQNGRPSGLRLSYKIGEPVPKAVTFRFDIVDEKLRQSMGSRCEILMQDRAGRWQKFEKLSVEDLVSGRVFRVRVQADGYQPKEFAIRVEPGQTEVSIQAALAPETGGLRFTTNMPSIGFSINGQRYMLSGDETRALKELTVSRGKPLDLKIPPGTYTLEAGSGKRLVKKTISVESGRSASLEFFQDARSKDIGIR
jgi:eukaryotic-like serine/threonine-protein kinase